MTKLSKGNDHKKNRIGTIGNGLNIEIVNEDKMVINLAFEALSNLPIAAVENQREVERDVESHSQHIGFKSSAKAYSSIEIN